MSNLDIDNRIINAFIKKTQKILKRDIENIEQRKREYMRRKGNE